MGILSGGLNLKLLELNEIHWVQAAFDGTSAFWVGSYFIKSTIHMPLCHVRLDSGKTDCQLIRMVQMTETALIMWT